MKLHLGCGNIHIDGFVNIDIRKLESADIVEDIKTLPSFKNESADLIYCSHVLEHFGRSEYMMVLLRWYNILKKGGILRLAVPDIEKVFLYYSEHKNLEVLRGFLWGGQTYPEDYHYCGWDFKTLKKDLLAIGFHSVKQYNWQEVENIYYPDYAKSYLPHDEEAILTGNFTDKHLLMSLNVEAIK